MFWRLVFGVGYVVMGTFCVAGLLTMDPEDFGSEASRYTAIFIASLLAVVSFSGLATILFIPLFDRCRPGPVLATAPSRTTPRCSSGAHRSWW